jgi:hypothetical protein
MIQLYTAIRGVPEGGSDDLRFAPILGGLLQIERRVNDDYHSFAQVERSFREHLNKLVDFSEFLRMDSFLNHLQQE